MNSLRLWSVISDRSAIRSSSEYTGASLTFNFRQSYRATGIYNNPQKEQWTVKSLLHWQIFHPTSAASFLATKVAPKITKCNTPRQQLVLQIFFLLPQTLQELELDFRERFYPAKFSVRCNLSRNAFLDQPILIILSSVELLRVAGSPIAQSVTLFMQLQCYAFKRCETIYTKNCLV